MNGRRKFLKGAALLSIMPAISLDVLAKDSQQESNLTAQSFRVMTANIRVDLKVDDEKGVGWKDRRDFCIEVIKKYNPDIVGIQEAFYQQSIDLRAAFKDYYFLNYDGPEMMGITEYAGIAKNPLLIKKSRFELLSVGCYWLSETPNIAGSESWGTYRARHVNHVLLRDKITHKDFRFLNTHLSTNSGSGAAAKLKQMEMIMADVKQYKDEFPQIFIGDLNSTPNSAAIKIALDNNFKDEYILINGEENPGATAHAFLGDKFKDAKGKIGNRIDYILTRGNVRANSCVLIKDKKGDKYPSDHYFMYGDLEI